MDDTGTTVAIGLAAAISDRRKAVRLGQQELADLSGTSERFIRNLEHGKTTVRLDKLIAVLDVLGLELRAELRRRG